MNIKGMISSNMDSFRNMVNKNLYLITTY